MVAGGAVFIYSVVLVHVHSLCVRVPGVVRSLVPELEAIPLLAVSHKVLVLVLVLYQGCWPLICMEFLVPRFWVLTGLSQGSYDVAGEVLWFSVVVRGCWPSTG